MQHRRRQLALPLVLVLLAAGSCVAQAQSGLTGTIRDLHGKPQMGVLIELFGPTSTRNAITDLEGRYQFRDVVPGDYQLRATAALYLPSLRSHLQLRPRGSSVLNLTLTGLFDEAAWISTRGNRGGQRDDWTWTLRSPENRPILRLAEDTAVRGQGSLDHGSPSSEIHASNATTFSKGVFGASGLADRFQIARRSPDQRTTLSAESQVSRTPAASSASPLYFASDLQSGGAGQTRSVIAARVESFPQIYGGYGRGVTVADFSSAQRMAVGEIALVEVGSQSHVVTAGHSTLINRPFVRVATRPIAGWIVNYSGAVSPEFARFDDVSAGTFTAPFTLADGNKLLTETGLHQQVGLRKISGHAALRIAYQHDMNRRTAVSGQVVAFARQGGTIVPLPASSAFHRATFDASNGLFRVFAPGYSASGVELGADFSLGSALSASGTYVRGATAQFQAMPVGAIQSVFSSGPSQAFIAAAQGKFPRSRTKAGISYRWQPSKALSVIAPYTSPEIKPYLGVSLRQMVSAKPLGLDHVEILVDADNLLGEGYHTYLLGGQRVHVASALCEVRAGVEVSY